MSLEDPKFVTEEEFGAELAGQRIGWTAITDYGNRPDDLFAIHIVTTTIGEEGASLEYEPREEDGKPYRAYWNHAAKGFIALAGISVIVDTENAPDEQDHVRFGGSYHAFNDHIIRGSSDGRILRQAGGAHIDEDELREKRVWAKNPAEIVENTKQSMAAAGIIDYYPVVYYTANMLLGHDGFKSGTGLDRVPVETLLLPDDRMHETTGEQISVAQDLVGQLSVEDKEDETMQRNLTVLSEIPPDQIFDAFEASRGKVADAEKKVIETEKKLYSQYGVYLPVGAYRSWPYMDALDDRVVEVGLEQLHAGNIEWVASALKGEQNELEARIEHASKGVTALESLSSVEAELA